MNRLDKTVVFHPLRDEQLEQILEIELGQVQKRVLETARGQFLFRVTPAARRYLLREGTDTRYGARHLKRAIERHLVYPLANLLATGQVRLGDVLCVDWDSDLGRLVFEREGEGAVIPAPMILPLASEAGAIAATGGRGEEVPAVANARSVKLPPSVSGPALSPAPISRRKS
jgi:hypothetical protein